MLYIHKMFYVHISHYRIYFANLSSLAICIEKVMGVVGRKIKKTNIVNYMCDLANCQGGP